MSTSCYLSACINWNGDSYKVEIYPNVIYDFTYGVNASSHAMKNTNYMTSFNTLKLEQNGP